MSSGSSGWRPELFFGSFSITSALEGVDMMFIPGFPGVSFQKKIIANTERLDMPRVLVVGWHLFCRNTACATFLAVM